MDPISRRSFATISAGMVLGVGSASAADEKPAGPVEAPFSRDYPPPGFKPSWKKQQINRLLVQDFVIYAHSELEMVKKLLEREPALLNGTMDWGGGDWESGLGGASHMGRRDIVEYLLDKGARIDIFCAAMMGQLDAVKSFLTMQPKLIDAKGPHGFTLHFHAQVGGKESAEVLDYLQSIKKLELKPVPFLAKPADDYSKFEGTWKMASLEVDGNAMPEESVKESRLTIKGKEFTMQDKAATYRGTFEVDATKKPKTIDIKFTDGPEKGNTSLGIYELNGDELKVCLTITAKDRPTEFAAKARSGLGLEVWKREKAIRN